MCANHYAKSKVDGRDRCVVYAHGKHVTHMFGRKDDALAQNAHRSAVVARIINAEVVRRGIVFADDAAAAVAVAVAGCCSGLRRKWAFLAYMFVHVRYVQFVRAPTTTTTIQRRLKF